MPESQDTSFCSQIYMFDLNEQLQRQQQLIPNLDPTKLSQLQTIFL
ncbi:5665_t:CDS:1, partial [Racocetra fulgida]